MSDPLYPRHGADFESCPVGTQAELVRLREEVTALRLTNGTLMRQASGPWVSEDLRARAEKAEAQVATLRAALERANTWAVPPREALGSEVQAEWRRDVATIRAALASAPAPLADLSVADFAEKFTAGMAVDPEADARIEALMARQPKRSSLPISLDPGHPFERWDRCERCDKPLEVDGDSGRCTGCT